MNYKQITGNVLGVVAAQQAIVAVLPVEWQPIGNAVLGIATVLAGLFQKQPHDDKK